MSNDIPNIGRTRHDWITVPERRIPACESPDGNDRTEKTCCACRLVKITSHYPAGLPGREWRFRSGHISKLTATPMCVPLSGEVEAM